MACICFLFRMTNGIRLVQALGVTNFVFVGRDGEGRKTSKGTPGYVTWAVLWPSVAYNRMS